MVTIPVRRSETSRAVYIVPTLSLAAATIRPGGGSHQAPLPFDEALREKVFFRYQALIQVAAPAGLMVFLGLYGLLLDKNKDAWACR